MAKRKTSPMLESIIAQARAPKHTAAPCFAWQLTPEELAASWRASTTTDGTQKGTAPKPFACAKRKLAGTGYTYQIAVSDRAQCPEMQAVAQACPDLPRSGDTRSGVIIFDGDRVVASQTILGVNRFATRSVWVDATYRGKGLGALVIELWYREVPRPTVITTQRVNAASARAYLRAHEHAVAWAVSEGREVPAAVTAAIAAGKQRAAIEARFGAKE